MKDDYLWDKSGEADPEVEELELLLTRFRYEPKPLELPAPPRRVYWPHLAAAAVLLVALAAGLWFYLQKSGVESQESRVDESTMAQQQQPPKPNESDSTSSTEEKPEKAIQNESEKQQVASLNTPKPVKRRVRPAVKEESVDTGNEFVAVGARQPLMIPFLDAETTRHIERSQFLLRDFRNLAVSENKKVSDITYERERSRKLLSDNILLRRNAESTGNLPVEELLGSLEPILLDIANLPEKPAADDVRLIRERIQKKEIIATLQVYSAQAVNIAQ